jgi:hypothetical protein
LDATLNLSPEHFEHSPVRIPVVFDRELGGGYSLGVAVAASNGVVTIAPTSNFRPHSVTVNRAISEVWSVELLSPVDPIRARQPGSNPAEMFETLKQPTVLHTRGQVTGLFETNDVPDKVRLLRLLDDVLLVPFFEDWSSLLARVVDVDESDDETAFEVPAGRLRHVGEIVAQIRTSMLVSFDDFSHIVFREVRLPVVPLTPAALIRKDCRITGLVELTETDGEVHFRFRVDEQQRVSQLAPMFVVDGTIEPLDGSRWRADFVQGRIGDFGVPELTGVVGLFCYEHRDGDAAMTVEALHTEPLGGFSHKTFSPTPHSLELITAPNTIATAVFGREARLFNVRERKSAVAVAYRGSPLSEEESTSLLNLVSYLTGSRGAPFATETFDAEGRALRTELRSRSSVARGIPPIRLDPWSRSNRVLAEGFSDLLNAFHTLRLSNPAKMNAALHHYYAGTATTYPTDQLLQLNVALEALVALTQGNNKKRILERAEFRIIRKALVVTLKRVGEGLLGLSSDNLADIKQVIDNLNKPSTKRRARAFWKSAGIVLTQVEENALRTRQPSVHEGHVGDERFRTELMRNFDTSRVLVNLFNRALLSYLGWRGKYRDAKPGSPWREHFLRVGDGRYRGFAVKKDFTKRYGTSMPKREARLAASVVRRPVTSSS